MTKLLTLKKQYVDWISQETEFKQLDKNTIRIDTPFLDNDFDNVILYVDLLNNNQILITDDGYTLANLASLGYSFSNRTKKRTHILSDICNSFGIEFDLSSKELYIKTDFDKFAIGKHRLLQAILKVNDMFLLHPNYEPNSTFEKVSNLLDKNDILYSTKYPAIGKGGITFVFDFSVPTRKKKDKLVRIINSPNDLNYSKVLGMDASMLKGSKEANYFAVLDDVNHELKNFSEIKLIYNEVKKNYGVDIFPLKFSSLEKDISVLSNT